MNMRPGLLDVFHGRSNVLLALVFSVLALMGIETIIFIAAQSASGESSIIEIKDSNGQVVYQSKGGSAHQLDKWYFERKYGNLDNYDIQVRSVDQPFPVRAWVSASVGVPVVLILLVSYLVKVYLILLRGDENPDEHHLVPQGKTPQLISWSRFMTRSSIFYLGVFVAMASLMFWMVPNLLAEVIQVSIGAIQAGEWLVVGAASCLVLFGAWIVFLRYRLSRRLMDHQYSLEKLRLEHKFGHAQKLVTEMQEPAKESAAD